jgi:hypothetical protein
VAQADNARAHITEVRERCERVLEPLEMQMKDKWVSPGPVLKGFYEAFTLVIHEISLDLYALLLHRIEWRPRGPKHWITMESGEEAS